MNKNIISVGEWIDRLSILNIKIWHTEEALADAHKKKDILSVGKLAIKIKTLSRERSDTREEINECLEGFSRQSKKMNFMNIGRDK